MSEVPTAGAQQQSSEGDLEQQSSEMAAASEVEGEAAALIVEGRRSIVLPNSWTWLQWRVVSAAVVLTACIGIALRSVVLDGWGGGETNEAASSHDQGGRGRGVRLPGVQEEVLVSGAQLAHHHHHLHPEDADDDGRPCHTAVRGEECYGKVLWAMEVGIPDHPEWYHKKKIISSSSSSSSYNLTAFLEVQSALHELSAASDCPKPCRVAGSAVVEALPEPEASSTLPQQSSRSSGGGSLSCNPSACEWGVTCKNAAAICCAEDDWECCADGDDRYKNRMYCPLKGHYKVMCWNGECADSEEVCASEERGGVKFGVEACHVQAQRMRYVGCYMDDVSNGDLQSEPMWCSSVEECQCGAEYPFVAFLNGNTEHHPKMAQWSCLSELPSTSFKGCTSYGAWEVGAPGTYMSVYWNPLSKTKTKTKTQIERRIDAAAAAAAAQPAAAVLDMTQIDAGGRSEVLPACHTALRSEDCFNFILWSISIGIHDHPTWYDGKITSQSSFEEIQAAVASQKTSKCGQPCPVDLMRRRRNEDPDRSTAEIARRRAAWNQRLSAESSSSGSDSPQGICHSTVPGERCYNVVTWAMQTRIFEHPNWEGSGLTENSSMQEVQDVLHMDEGAGCPRACSSSSSSGAAAAVAVVASGGSSPPRGPPCNPTMCARGLTCQGNGSSSCCEEGDWGCCGRGPEKYRNRKYCPSRGGYTVMCNNRECADSLEECGHRGGVHYGAELCPAPAHYVGCFVEGSGALGILQTSPLWCSSMEECQCPPEFPYVGYSNGNTLHYPGRAQWSCYPDLPSQTWSGCASYGRWEVGAPGPYVSIYRNLRFYHHDDAATEEEEEEEDHPRRRPSHPPVLAPALSTPWPCHTAVRGEACFSAVLWVLATGLSERSPDVAKLNLAENSTFEEVQLALSLNQTAACPLPCIIASPAQVAAAQGLPPLGLDADREAEEMEEFRGNGNGVLLERTRGGGRGEDSSSSSSSSQEEQKEGMEG